MSRLSVGTLISCLVFLLIAHAVLGYREACNPLQLEKCEKPLRMLGQADSFQFVPEGTDVKHICEELQSAMKCLEHFVDNCVPEEEMAKVKLDTLLAGVSQFLRNICDENSELYKGYMKYGKCMATVSKEAETCTKYLKITFDRTSKSSDGNQEKIEATCCALQRHYDCTRNAYLSKCGEGAANIIAKSLKLMYGNIIEGKCNDENGNPKCSSAFTVRPAAILFSLVAIFWACQRKLW